MTTCHGSCHCGAVRYEADIDLAVGTLKCNCTVCTKMRWWAILVAPSAFRLLQGSDALREYRYLTRRNGHHFCGICGINVFTIGNPASARPFVAIAVASLDDVPVDALLAAPVQYVDGRNDAWHVVPADVRHL